jgi:hypothetical protein
VAGAAAAGAPYCLKAVRWRRPCGGGDGASGDGASGDASAAARDVTP